MAIAREATLDAAVRDTGSAMRGVIIFTILMLAIAAAAAMALVLGPGDELVAALVPFVLALSPAVIALTLAAIEGGGAARRLLRATVRVPSDRRWFLVVLIPVGAALATVGITVALGAPTDRLFDRLLTPVALVIPMIVLLPAFTEEVAWRGYVLPRLAAQMSPLTAALVVAVPWTVIHYVLHLPGAMNADAELWATTVSLVALSVVLGWVYFGTGGSVLLAGLVHASFNAVVPITWGVSDFDADLVFGVSAIVTAAIAIAIVILGGFRGRRSA